MSEINSVMIPELKTEVKDLVITYNFAEYKNAIEKLADSYKVVQYSEDADEQLKQLREDRATLNKQKADIDEKRKKLKNMCLAPITKMEEEFKELQRVIDIPCNEIDSTIKNIEEQARAAKKREILEFFRDAAVVLDDKDAANFLWGKLYKKEWENKTCSKKKYKEEIQNGIKTYLDGMTALNAITSDFKEDGIKEFKDSLDLAAAMAVINNRQKQQDEAVERAKRKMQEEEEKKIREAEEQARREEQKKNEEVRLAMLAAQQKAVAEEARARKAEEERLKAEEEAKKASDAKKTKIFVKLEDGMLTIFANNSNVELAVLDMDMSPSDKEIVAFNEAIAGMEAIY